MKRKQASKKAGARRSPTEVSAMQLAAVSGGARVGGAIPPDSPALKAQRAALMRPKPSQVGQVINGVTVTKNMVNSDGQVSFGVHGELHGAAAVAAYQKRANMQAAFDKIGNGIVNALKATPIGMAVNGIVTAAKAHSAGAAFTGMLQGAADAFTHGAASQVINPLAAGKRGKDAATAIGIGLATTAADNATRGFAKIATSGVTKVVLEGAGQAAKAAANKANK
jgi:hypothetical protein